MFTGLTYGDLGDCIGIIPIARALVGMELYAQNHALCKPILAPARFNALKPLMEHSPYIHKFEPWQGQSITHNMATFREGGIPWGHSLCRLHADWVKVKISEEPWLEVEPDPEFTGCIVVNRSTRHRSFLANWKPILEHYQPDIVFLGLREEHQQLVNETGVQMRHHPTSDLLQCARIIEASRAFLGNQSCLLNIAIATGKKYLCEASLSSADCIYRRPGSYYMLDGGVENFEVEGYEPLNLPSNIPRVQVDWNSSPPGNYWKMYSTDGVEFRDINPKKLVKLVNEHESSAGVNLSTMQDLADQTHVRHPRWGYGSHSNYLISQVNNARNLINKINQ